MIAVEGYVDVIAMVTAGFAATVAPLGTALTEDQLALLWRMADEPILCFDGDDAGRRAAYRAVDLALPQLKPGKSLRFALLPDGQDPDDLVRSGGREAVDEVLDAARPLADMLWARETEAGAFDTPERRAALEARDQRADRRRSATMRCASYYRQDFGDAPAAGCSRRPTQRDRAARLRGRGRLAASRAGPQDWPARQDDGRGRPAAQAGRAAYVVASPAARREPDAARPSQRVAAARGADPAGR